MDWQDFNTDNGSTGVSPDLERSFDGATIPAIFTSGTKGFGLWDPTFFLDGLLAELSDPSVQCSEVFRNTFVVGGLDGLAQGELCQGEAFLRVNIAVSNAARDSIIFHRVQLVDERDYDALERFINSYSLINPGALPDSSQ